MLKYRTGLMVTCLYVTLVALMAACQASPLAGPSGRPDPAKIKFRLDDINSVGLRGPADGLVSVAYEFCAPANEQVYLELRRIDASLQISPGASGRSGCTQDQALAIGNTGQPGWHGVLDALSSLDYVAEIRECFFE
jgi:hypothetical protein